MRRRIDKLLFKLGYGRIDLMIKGQVVLKGTDRPFVDLTLPSGHRVVGHVDNLMPGIIVNPTNPIFAKEDL